MRRSTLVLAVMFLSGCSWLSTGLPSGGDASSTSSASSDAMMEQGSSSVQSVDGMMEASSSAMSHSASSVAVTQKSAAAKPAPVAMNGMYAAYHDGVIGNGETSVLFFHAAWCPYCQQADKDLTQWYGSTGFPLTVYKVDYDTQTELKSRYGVTTQHTFVKIDGSGNAVKTIVGPTDATLKALLGA